MSAFSLGTSCQTQADWWYFGEHAGLHFTPSGPVADTNGALFTYEGCAAISDANGNLLFYTDGISVYDSTHQQMPHGNDLFGNPSSVQSGVIVPFPGQPFKYFIFTTDSPVFPHKGFCYSIVDLNLNGGLGDVDTNNKNILLFTPTCEKVTAVADATNDGYWVAGYKALTDSIFTYHVTSSGVGPQTFAGKGSLVINNSFITDRQWGQMKFSPNGKYLAIVQGYNTNFGFVQHSMIDFFEFDNATGTCGDRIIIYQDSVGGSRYGLEFSSSSQKLYSSTRSDGPLLQFDVSLFDSVAITSSQYVIDSNAFGGALQMAPDGKIYGPNVLYVGRINYPESSGSFVGYEPQAVYLEGKSSFMSIPTLPQSFFREEFVIDQVCEGDSTQFTSLYNADSIFWNFGDSASGALNTSTDSVAHHFYSQPGTYFVVVKVWRNGFYFFSSDSVVIYPQPRLSLVKDTTLCNGDTLSIDISQPYSTYLWGNGDTLSSISIVADTQFSVTVFGYCDSITDSIKVTFKGVPELELGNDTTLCAPAFLTLDTASLGNSIIYWSSGDSASQLPITLSGKYSVTIENACGSTSDSLFVNLDSIPTIHLPADTIICEGESLVVDRPDELGVEYLWFNNSNASNITVDTSSTAWLKGSNECGSSADTMKVSVVSFATSSLGTDTTICTDDEIILDATSINADYSWNTGATTPFIRASDTTAVYIVTVTIGRCVSTLVREVRISQDACPDCEYEGLNVFTPNADGINDLWMPESTCSMEGTSLLVFNRWGILVFSGNEAVHGWDGTVNGSPAAEGVYFYQLYKGSEKPILQGSFSLLRN
ncbi:MAG: gliding motility-associated C-terminal domain-containing protein [Flavobacteriales bacterium]